MSLGPLFFSKPFLGDNTRRARALNNFRFQRKALDAAIREPASSRFCFQVVK